MHIYVPDLNNYNCFYVQSEGVVRAYEETPRQNTTINYRDYYINSSYIYKDGVAQFGTYSILPTCLSSSVLTDNVFYRNDIDKILVSFIIIIIFCFYFPYRILSRAFGRWLRI